MILGLSLHGFTILHVIISLIGIASGLIVLIGMFGSNRLSGLTALFLGTTILTSVTGFFFPRTSFTPAQAFGVLSLLVLAPTVLALYGFHLRGMWRWVYVAGAVIALYLNSFVGIVQSFQKIGFLHPLAPNGSGPVFFAAQGVLLLIFIGLGLLAVQRFHPERLRQQARHELA